MPENTDNLPPSGPQEGDRGGEREPAPQPHVFEQSEPDQAAQSLSDALHASFKLLTVIMIGFVVAFLATGIRTISPSEVGIKTRFGRIVDQADEGLTFAWPYPVGDVITVNISQQQQTIDDFWLYETAAEKTKPLLQRTAQFEGLRPGWEGALLTGDRGLLHMRLNVTWHVAFPQKFVSNVGTDPNAPRDAIRSAVCGAAIRSAATRTVDALQRGQRAQFASQLQRLAQDELSMLDTGIEIDTVLLSEATWPLRALPAYDAAQQVDARAEKIRSDARAEAENILSAAAGAAYLKLVGDPAQFGRDAAQTETPGEAYNLIGKYIDARDAGDARRAETLRREINDVLLSNTLGGDASRIIAEARAEKTSIQQRVASRSERFKDLVGEYEQSGQFLLDRLWARTRDEILNAATVEKFYLTVSDVTPTVIRINRDPDIAREIAREALQAEREQGGNE